MVLRELPDPGGDGGDRVAVIDLGEQGRLREKLASPCRVEYDEMIIHGPTHEPDVAALDCVHRGCGTPLAEQHAARGKLTE